MARLFDQPRRRDRMKSPCMLGLVLAALFVADCQAALTLKEATEISQRTGRLLFAVAGSET